MTQKCVLFAPRVNWVDEFYAEDILLENPGLGQLAAILETAGCQVEIIDGNIEEIRSFSDIDQFLEGASFLGLSLDSSVINEVIEWLPLLKKKYPDLRIALGDYAVTLAWRDIVERLPDNVVLCIGEGEVQLQKWAASGFSYQELDFINGIAFRRNGEIIYHAPCEIVGNLDELPFMNRQILEGYINPRVKCAILMTSRGCPFGCSFCSRPAYRKISKSPAWRARSIENVEREVLSINEKFGLEEFFIFDDQFPGSNRNAVNRLIEFHKIFKEYNRRFKFRLAMRADTVYAIGEYGVNLMWESGIERVFIGLESFDYSQISEYGKPKLIDKNYYSCNLLEKAGILIHCGFINFSPSSTKETLLNNARGLHETGQSAYFRNFSSILFYGPGSKFIPTADSIEMVSYYKSCESDLSPNIMKIYKHISALYAELARVDLRLEKNDFLVFRKINGNTKLPLFSEWKTIRSKIGLNNFGLYKMAVEEQNVQSYAKNILLENMGALDQLEELIAQ